MSEGLPSLQELAEAAPAPEGVSPAVAVIAASDVRTLDGAVISTSIGAERAESDLQAAQEKYDIFVGAEENLQENSQAIKAKVAGQLQDIIQEMYEKGEVPPADLLDDLMLLQDDDSTVMEMRGPADDEGDHEVDTDTELRAERDAATWNRFVLQERLEAARADRDAAQERVGFTALAKEIEAVRRRLSMPLMHASALLCSLVIGAGAAGLAYKAETMSNRGAAEITRQTNREFPDHRQPVPSTELDANDRIAIGAFGSLGLLVGGLGGMWAGGSMSGRTARWRARRIVRKAEAAEPGQPEE